MSSDSDTLYLSAAEAAAYLGVSRPTLYVYVSRKLIRSEALPGNRAHRYWRADIDRLKQSDKLVPCETALAPESHLTLLTRGGQFYRGHDAIELSRHASFEDVVLLLWEAAPEIFNPKPLATDPTITRFLKQIADWTAVDQAMCLFPLIERSDARAYDLSPHGYVRTGATVLRWFAALVAGTRHGVNAPMHEFLAAARQAPEGFDQVIRALLVLNADHELDPSTYAVRKVKGARLNYFDFESLGAGAPISRRQDARRLYKVGCPFLFCGSSFTAT